MNFHGEYIETFGDFVINVLFELVAGQSVRNLELNFCVVDSLDNQIHYDSTLHTRAKILLKKVIIISN